MAEWLSTKEAPAGFTIDRECELKQPDSEKSLVRYARHTLEIDEVGEHIRQGKLPTQLAMTWDSRVSFVLTEQFAIKKIKLLDVVLEGQEAAGKGDDNFDADVAITTGELGKLLPDLVEALGGPLELGAAGVTASATDKVIAALTGQTAAMGAASPYAPANAEDASAPF
jgi:recombination associated protein RdgC